MAFYKVGLLTVISEWLSEAYEGFKIENNMLTQRDLSDGVILLQSDELSGLEIMVQCTLFPAPIAAMDM